MTSTVPCKCLAKQYLYIHLPNYYTPQLSECIKPTLLFKDCHTINSLLNTRELLYLHGNLSGIVLCEVGSQHFSNLNIYRLPSLTRQNPEGPRY